MNNTTQAANIINAAIRIGHGDSFRAAQALADNGLLRDDEVELPLLPEIGEINTPVLHVDIDALALLEHLDDDQEKTFDFLGKLKDLLG